MSLTVRLEQYAGTNLSLRRTHLFLVPGTALTTAIDTIIYLGARFITLTIGPFSQSVTTAGKSLYPSYAGYRNCFALPFGHLLALVHPKVKPNVFGKDLFEWNAPAGVFSWWSGDRLAALANRFFKWLGNDSVIVDQIASRVACSILAAVGVVTGVMDIALGIIAGLGALCCLGTSPSLNRIAIQALRAAPSASFIQGIALVINPDCITQTDGPEPNPAS